MEKDNNEAAINRAVNTALRISFIALLIILSFWILKPFLAPVAWGIIFAIGIFPLHKKLSKLLGNKDKVSATIIGILGVALVVVPVVLFANSTIDGVHDAYEAVEAGTFKIDPPNESVADWPIIGEKAYEAWSLASENLTALILKYEAQLRGVVPKITSAVGGLVSTVLLFIISIVIASSLLLFAEPGKAAANKVFATLIGEKGKEFTELSMLTIRSVVQGVIGIAVIQTFFLSIGMFFMGIPATGIISIIVLIVAIIQLPPTLVMLPVIIYAFSMGGTTAAIIFTIWSIFWSLADTFLKPMLLGKGVDVPMLVILLGAIGGMLLSGPVGLFVGAVVLALTYKIFDSLVKE